MTAHLIFAYMLSGTFLCSAGCYSVAILANSRYPNRYAAVFAVYTVVLCAYLYLMLFGPDKGTLEGLQILATGQKIIIYSGMLCWFLQFVGAYAYQREYHECGN
jgi:hypothetical protein